MVALRYRAKRDVLTTNIDGELVMMDVSAGQYYCIRGAGLDLWHGMADWVDEDRLVRDLRGSFAIGEDAARRDVLEFLGDLQRFGLVEVSS